MNYMESLQNVKEWIQLHYYVFSLSSCVLQLRKAVMDHISDSFLETNVPLLVLIEAAKSGNEKEVKEYAQVFREHANKLVEVSHELYALLYSQTTTVVTILIVAHPV